MGLAVLSAGLVVIGVLLLLLELVWEMIEEHHLSVDVTFNPARGGYMPPCCLGASVSGVSLPRSGHLSADFAGTAPTFLNQHLWPSISRHDHQPDSE